MSWRAQGRTERRKLQRTQKTGPIRLPDISPIFTVFVRETLGKTLTPGQTVFAKVAYDNWEPRDLIGEERVIARQIFGDLDTIPPDQRSIIAAVFGGRAGKTLTSAWRLVHGMFMRDLSLLTSGGRAVALAVAPNDDLRQEIVNYAIGAIRESVLAPSLIVPKGTKPDDQVSRFSVRRNDGHIVGFRCAVATRGGYGGRGRWLTDFFMDEACFFRGADSQVNDAEIFRAASARVIKGGQSLVFSTPWAETGLLYEFWATCWGKTGEGVTALVGHAPTIVMNDSEQTAFVIEREYKRDPDNASREFGALFMSGGTLLFFELVTLDAAKGLPCPIDSPRDLLPGDVVAAGIDAGFRSDSSALCIVVRRAEIYYPVVLLERRPERGKPLKPSETIKEFTAKCVEWGVLYVMADGHYIETVREHTSAANLSLVAAPNSNERPYVRTRNLLRESRVTLPDNPRLVQQMKEVRSKALAGGGLSIQHPRWATGGHGDVCEAYVLAIDQAGGAVVPTPPPQPGSREEMEAEREKRRKWIMEEQRRAA